MRRCVDALLEFRSGFAFLNAVSPYPSFFFREFIFLFRYLNKQEAEYGKNSFVLETGKHLVTLSLTKGERLEFR